MAYVRETSLVECTFTGSSDVPDIRVRYFLASRDIPFVGHPMIATLAAMRSRDLIKGEVLSLETGTGLVSIRLDGNEIEMTQVSPRFGVHVPAVLVTAAASLPEDTESLPQVVSICLPFSNTVLSDHEAPAVHDK